MIIFLSSNMRNGPKVTHFVALVKPGCMLEYPSIRRYSSRSETVTMRPVRTISREVVRFCRIDPSETTRQGLQMFVGKIWSGLHGDMQRSTEMIDPLRLRSQLISGSAYQGPGK